MSRRRGNPKSSKAIRHSKASAKRPNTALQWGVLVALAIAVAVGYGRWQNQPKNAVGISDEQSGSNRANISERPPNGDFLPTLTTASNQAKRAIATSQLDPGNDGWETEVVAEQAKKQLQHLAERWNRQTPNGEVTGQLETEVMAYVTSGQLRPAALSEVFREGTDDGRTVVRRARTGSDSGTETEADSSFYSGRDGLQKAFEELGTPLTNASGIYVHIKVVRIDITSTSAATTAYYEAAGKTPDGSLQQRATWECQWERSQGKLLLKSIRATDYEEVLVAGPWLVDRTEVVLGENASFREQLSLGHHHWLSRLGRSHGIHAFSRSGMAVGDVNGDGFDDIYVCQPGGLPNRLFVQQRNGTAIDRSKSGGVDWLEHTSSALIVDLDNDGDQDLVAATTSGLLLMENDGQGNFNLRLTLATGETDTQSFSSVDYDQDGNLDLYVCIEFANRNPIDGEEFVYHDANDGAANLLFRNEGEWSFQDVTKQVGLDVDNHRHSLACAWEDYDNDGDQDLYVANDYGQNCLYQNENGQFRNVATEANATDSASGMSVSWGDYNRDGWMDLYVANMFSSAGNRITRQAQFKPGADEKMRDIYSRFAKGNTLLENDGQGKFREVSESAGVEMGRWAWSSVFADLNNDSMEDLLVANGYITTEDTGDL